MSHFLARAAGNAFGRTAWIGSYVVGRSASEAMDCGVLTSFAKFGPGAKLAGVSRSRLPAILTLRRDAMHRRTVEDFKLLVNLLYVFSDVLGLLER